MRRDYRYTVHDSSGAIRSQHTDSKLASKAARRLAAAGGAGVDGYIQIGFKGRAAHRGRVPADFADQAVAQAVDALVARHPAV